MNGMCLVDGKCLWIACVYRKYLSACVYGRYMSVDGICLWMARICGHVSMVSMWSVVEMCPMVEMYL